MAQNSYFAQSRSAPFVPDVTAVTARWIWLCVGLFACLPFAVSAVPPLMDLPGHMARFHIMRDLAGSPDLQRYYSFDWALLGNLGVDLFVYALKDVLSVERATWLACLFTVSLSAFAIYRLSRAVHGSAQPTAFLALPFIYSYFFQYGFLNFALSVPLALIVLALWLERGNRPVLNACVFGLFSIGLWLCHTMGWGIFALCAGLSVLQRQFSRHRWNIMQVMLNTGAQTWPLALPIVLMLVVRGDVPSPERLFSNSFLIDKFRFAAQSLRDRSLVLDLASLLLLFGFPVVALWKKWAVVGAKLLWPAIGLGFAYVVMPSSPFFGALYTDARLFPVAAIVALVALKWAHTRQMGLLVAGCAVALFAVRVTLTTSAWQKADRDAARHLQALVHIPVGARVMSAVALDCDKHVWATDFLLNHLPAMAVLRRNAYINSMWQIRGQQALRVRYNAESYYNSDPSQYFTIGSCRDKKNVNDLGNVVRHFPREKFDYFWIMDPPPTMPAELNDFPVLYRDDRTVLLKIPAA